MIADHDGMRHPRWVSVYRNILFGGRGASMALWWTGFNLKFSTQLPTHRFFQKVKLYSRRRKQFQHLSYLFFPCTRHPLENAFFGWILSEASGFDSKPFWHNRNFAVRISSS